MLKIGVDIETYVFYGALYGKRDVEDHFMDLVKFANIELEDITYEDDLDKGFPGKDRKPTEEEYDSLMSALSEISEDIYYEDEEEQEEEADEFESSESNGIVLHKIENEYEDDDWVLFLGHVLAAGSLITNPVRVKPLTPEIKRKVDEVFKKNNLGEPKMLLFTNFEGY